ncbi:CASP-like protein [Melia azedarach]|uniref:CASP-like protein n=1 Tax=Melia azedarach TaxID=155640 RepID=A0ACC1XCX8_MELAZ|nr:CASP-like protein [Melia azedarach]
MELQKVEALLRVSSALLLISTACLVSLDTQTKVVFVKRRITYKQLDAFVHLVYVASAAAAYNLLQLGRCVFSSSLKEKSNKSYRYLAWVFYLLDQMVVYITFITNSAATEQAIIALNGAKVFQWMKWCSKFSRFCFQAGGAVVSAYLASALMALLTFISAFHLFRLYSPKSFLRLKNTQVN